MRVSICAMGRLRRGAQKELCDDYIDRFNKQGRSLNLGPLEVKEVDDRKAQTPQAQAALLEQAIPQGAYICALDERGAVVSSPQFAKKLEGIRDQSQRDLVFLIGGAEGLCQTLVQRADFTLSFGKMVWPHMLARVMLTEQLYRAVTILSGSPYHKM